jgi:hypothetical protein
MSREWNLALALLILAMIIMVVVKTSAVKLDKTPEGACRRFALETKGYATWQYHDTTRIDTDRYVTYSDGTTDRSCHVIPIGSFWAVTEYVTSFKRLGP